MKFLSKPLFCLMLVFSPLSVSEPLRFSYWPEATPPFVFVDNGAVYSGIIKELGDAIGGALNIPVTFINIPTQRTDSQLEEGLIDLSCITNPIWKKAPEAYHWSPSLFKGADRFLVKKQLQHKIKSFSDLKGLTIGIHKWYVYHETIMGMIESGEVNTIKISGIEQGVQLLSLGRIDALIDFQALLQYQIKALNLGNQFALADKYADQYDLHCAYSKKMPVSRDAVDAVINKLISSGKLDAMLSHYR